MNPLEPPDSHFFNAAVGWLELGLTQEAMADFARISPPGRFHPDARRLEKLLLPAHWETLAGEKRWTEALAVASRLLEIDRDQPTGWINRSYTLHELQRTQEAHETLIKALPLFPTLGIIPYNLACYACQMGHMDEARSWLRQAMEHEGREQILLRARDDRDLVALRDELAKL